MAKTSKKSTRKFEKNHLKDTIERRKDVAKIKQRNQIKTKKKARNAKERGEIEPKDGELPNPNASKEESSQENPLAQMDVDEFFQGGFEVPEKPVNGAKASKHHGDLKRSSKRKRIEEEEEEEEQEEFNDSDQEQDDDLSSGFSEKAETPPSNSSDDEGDPELDIGKHMDELDALAQKDPEFYKFLQENDAELLDFDDSKLVGKGDLTDSEEDPSPKKKRKKSKPTKGENQDENEDEQILEKSGEMEVTFAMLQKWKKAMSKEHSLRAMRQVVIAFRAAAYVNADEVRELKYSIGNPDVYHQLLVLTLECVPSVLHHHLPLKESSNGKIRVQSDSKKFRTLVPLLKSHLSAVLHLLTSLSDASTSNKTLKYLTELLPYVLSFKKALKNLIKIVSSIWSNPPSKEATRITAFLALRQLFVIGDAGMRELILKHFYQGLLLGSRSTTIHTVEGINLMKNSASELWGLDEKIGYTTGFSFIRQLAIHLRGCITNNAKDSYKKVYNWQYVHSLDFWSRVLSSQCETLKEAKSGKESALRPLIYPTVQITLGALRLIPTAQYFPLRFHLFRALLRISRSTGTYIPLVPSLLEVLSLAEMRKPPKPSTLKPLDFATSIRVPKSYLRTRVYQDGVGEQVSELLSEFFVLWTKSIAFPELALPVTVMVKRWLKEVSHKSTGNRNAKVNSALVLVIQKLEANGKWVEERRAKVDFAPNNRAGVDGFLKDVEWEKSPLGAFVVGQRLNRREKEKVLAESRRVDELQRGKGAAESEEDEGEEEEGEEEDDEEVTVFGEDTD
ncbi:MAG: Nucleolar Complex 2 protein [Trizodia sp. TS-e1964]|nr:MAG: Nucleolar Complex 2 protein [Trizodia sp. TS-e1964]